MKKRILSLMLAALLCLTLLPTASLATGTGKAIRLVTYGTAANIAGGQASSVYFGTYRQSSDGQGGYNVDPIKWRVLSNAARKLLLLSDRNLDAGVRYHEEYESVTWAWSTIRSWLNGYDASAHNGSSRKDYTNDSFIGTAFTPKEQAALSETSLTNDSNPYWETPGGEASTDKVFFLSIADLYNTSYGFAWEDNQDPARAAADTDYAASKGWNRCYWWLRSPGSNDCSAAVVDEEGNVNTGGYGVDRLDMSVRPAFHLDLNSVLFTSAAEGGKSSGAAGADALTEIPDNTGSDWKLTLLDGSRDFSVTETDASAAPGGSVTLHYTGATVYDTSTAPNEYISVILTDSSGEPLYYGRLAQPTETSGTVSVRIPAALADGSYTLKFFSEQYNGDCLTDYASYFSDVALAVGGSAQPIDGADKAIRLVKNGRAANIAGAQGSNVYFGTYRQSSDGQGGYSVDPIKWRVLSNAAKKLLLLSDRNLDAGMMYQEGYNGLNWARSTIRSWLNGYGPSEHDGASGKDYTNDSFIGTAFTLREQAALPETSLTNNNPYYNIWGGEDTTDKVFFLSIAEAFNTSYGFNWDRIDSDPARAAADTDYAASKVSNSGYWLLRSPGYASHMAAVVMDDGFVDDESYHMYDDCAAVRPACYLDLKSVLFTSAAEGGKSSGAAGADALTEIPDNTGSDWKLTLLDGSRDFSVTETDASAVPGGSVTLHYTGATVYDASTAPNEYISVILTDSSGEPLYYGRLAQPTSADGTVTVTVPAGLAAGSYTLYAFSEQYNGDKRTDLASVFSPITLTLSNTETETQAITVTQQPADVSVPLGEIASTTVVAEGEGLKYQWYGREANGREFKSSLKGDTYSVALVKSKIGRAVWCVITDKDGNTITTREAVLNVALPEGYAAPVITTDAENCFVDVGGTASVTIAAEGSEALSYQWYIRNAGSSSWAKSGLKGDTYECAMNAARDGRQIYCVVTDTYGNTAQTSVVTIGYDYPAGYTEPVITVEPESVIVNVGETASVTMAAEGVDLSYQWYLRDPGVSSFARSNIKTDTYSVKMVASKSGREVYCVVTDKYGNKAQTQTVTLSLDIPEGYTGPSITHEPEDASAAKGEIAATTVTAEGEELSYQWYLRDPGAASFSKSSLKGDTYSVKMIPSKSGREVYCVITDKYGFRVKTRTATLTMES